MLQYYYPNDRVLNSLKNRYKRLKMKHILIIISLASFLCGATAIASNLIATDHSHTDGSIVSHSGRTNKAGCHNDRKNGGYHCH